MVINLNLKRGFGVVLFWIGVAFILNSFSGITGYVVAEEIGKSVSSILGLVFVVGGLALFIRGNKLKTSLAEEVKKSGVVITNPKKLVSLAKQIGYPGRNRKEGYQVLDLRGVPITIIPRHRSIKKGTYRGIITALSTGESSFRRTYSHT